MTDIFVIGYPKTGSTWLCRLLGDILNSPVGCAYRPSTPQDIATEGQYRLGEYYIGHGHAMPNPNLGGTILFPNHLTINLNCLKDEKIIVIFRDPRDVVVSVDHHWGINNIHETIEKMAKAQWPIPHGGGLEKFYRAWLNLLEFEQWITYEQLSEQPYITLSHLTNYLGDGYHRIGDAIEHQSFANRRKWTEENGDTLNYGKEYQLRFLRKGIVGDWKNCFDQRAIDMCEEYWGDLMREMGYS